MAKTRQPPNTSTRLAGLFWRLASTAVRTISALAADWALAQRAATMAASPRQQLAEVRGLYTTPDGVLTSVRIDKAARSTAFESFESLSDYEEKRAA